MSFLASTITRLQDETTRSYVHFRYSANTIVKAGLICLFMITVGEFLFISDISLASIAVKVTSLIVWSSLFMLINKDLGGARNLRFWWIGTLNFCIPFALLLSYLIYATQPDIDNSARYFLAISYIVAICVYTQIMNSFVGASVGLIVTTAAAIGCHGLVTRDGAALAIESMFILSGQQTTAVFIGSILNRNPEIARYDSYTATRSVGQSIARDLKSVLRSIINQANVVGDSLPAVLWAHQEASKLGLVDRPLTNRQLQVISESPADIEKEALDAETLIDMLLVNIAQEPVYGQSFETITGFDLVESAAARYPYANDRERELVSFARESDFVISGPRLLLHHVLYNLMKNALYYVQKTGKGEIRVTVTAKDKRDPWSGGTITVHDTGPGIPASDLGSIFNRFFTRTEGGRGSGIGLHFCKTVIENLDGQIRVESELGKWTTFTIRFPPANPPEVSLDDLSIDSNRLVRND